MDELVNLIFEDVKSSVKKELGSLHKTSILVDDAFAKSKQLSFIGHEKELSQVEAFLIFGKNDIAIVSGAMGTGKSSLIANLPHIIKNLRYDFVSIFCGQNYSSDTAIGIVENIVSRLRIWLAILGEVDKQFYKTLNDWHKEMDRLIDLFISKSQNTHVIPVDAIDQMMQDINTKKLLFIPYTHVGKVKIILSMSDDYAIDSSLSLLEYMIQVPLATPSETEIKKVIDDAWVKYGKPSVSDSIKSRLLKKPMSSNYLYVNLLLTRLTFIGNEVFGDKKNNEEHIVNSICKAIDQFPDSLEEAAFELLQIIGEIINPQMAQWVFNYLILSKNGSTFNDLCSLCGGIFISADFFSLKQLMAAFYLNEATTGLILHIKYFETKTNLFLMRNTILI